MSDTNNAAIVNSGFEDPFQEDGIFTLTTPPGWELFDPNELIPEDPMPPSDSFVGVWNPPVSIYPDGVPEGEQVGFIFLAQSPGSDIVGLTQTLTTTLEEDTQYTLLVEVGDPLPLTDPNFPDIVLLSGFPGYQIQLLAGDTILALDDNSLEITEGTFETSVISFTAPEDHPNLGEPLAIRLLNLNEATGQEVNFDDVRLEISDDDDLDDDDLDDDEGSSINEPINVELEVGDPINGGGIVIDPIGEFIVGTDGNDTLETGDGNDILSGLGGDDLLTGGPGDDTLTGGFGSDIFELEPGGGTDTITDFELGTDLIGLSGGLTFDGLSLDGNDIINESETLATITGIDVTSLTTSDFIDLV